MNQRPVETLTKRGFILSEWAKNDIIEVVKERSERSLTNAFNLISAGLGNRIIPLFPSSCLQNNGGFIMSSNTQKQCRVCLQFLDYSNFYISKCNKDGFHNWCKACCNLKNKEYFEKNKTKFHERHKDYYQANRESIIAKQSLNDASRIEERKTYNKNYRIRTLEDRKKYERLYRQKHKKLIAARRLDFRISNPELISQRKSTSYQRNKDKIKARVKVYRKLNRSLYRTYWSRRKARKLGGGGTHTPGEWEYIKQIYDYRCLKCGLQEPGIKLTVDHVVPLSLGGSDAVGNLQPLCLSCNCSKHARIKDYRGNARNGKVNAQRDGSC